MSFKNFVFLLSAVFLILAFIGCGGGGGGSETVTTPEPINIAPVANAGDDQIVNEQVIVELIGNGTDSDGSITVYHWSQTDGSVIELNDVNAEKLTFVAPDVEIETTLTFQLNVTDNDNATHSDTVSVLVTNINTPPNAHAGQDTTITELSDHILIGQGTDSDGLIEGILWTQIDGPRVALIKNTELTTSFKAPNIESDTELIFELAISDNEGAVSTSRVKITILAGCESDGIESSWFCGDSEVISLINDGTTIQLPSHDFIFQEEADSPSEFGLQWRLIQGLRMIGYEAEGIKTGEVIGVEKFKKLDREVFIYEAIIAAEANKLDQYHEISAPNFINNLPQTYAAYMFSTIFELFNSGSKLYQKHSNQCLLANMVPNMCGALVDLAVVSGSCKSNPVFLDEIIIQTPELFSFENRRDAIGADEYPFRKDTVSSTYNYSATLIHEMVHDLDKRLENFSNVKFDRNEVCSGYQIDYDESENNPFITEQGLITRDINDFVSYYAAAISIEIDGYNVITEIEVGNYIDWEDFAESVTAYILLPEYFRERSVSSPQLIKKYDWIKNNVFDGFEFTNPSLTGISYIVPGTIHSFVQVNKLKRFELSKIGSLTN